MARRHISDMQVVAAVDAAIPSGMAAWRLLEYVTGQCAKVCIAAVERAYDRQLIDVGVNVSFPWLTEKGKTLLATNPNHLTDNGYSTDTPAE